MGLDKIKYKLLLRMNYTIYFLLMLSFKLNCEKILNETESNAIIRSIALPPELTKLSRLTKQTNTQMPRIQYESYKALVGETVRLECPQPNPTWFYRKFSSNNVADILNGNNEAEDLIVTRHGIINADYKYKIMCHLTLKHKVIIINNIDFDEEGLYTCLYTLPTSSESNKPPSLSSFSGGESNRNNFYSSDVIGNPVQFRYVFNVTVYSLISGLTMNLKPISMKTTLPPQMIFNNQKQKDPLNQQYELVDSSITVRENEEFLINCIVESSKPAADIFFSISNGAGVSSINTNVNKNGLITTFNGENKNKDGETDESESNSNDNYPPAFASFFSSQSLLLSTTTQRPASLISSNTNVAKNSDRTFKSIHSSRLKVSSEDHGKVLTCKAENGFSNQKWENKKLLNVLFAPVCKDPPRFTYYVGINQTVNIECRILNANPMIITYEWNLENVNKESNIQSSIFNTNSNNNDLSSLLLNNKINLVDTDSPAAERLINSQPGENNFNFQQAHSPFNNLNYYNPPQQNINNNKMSNLVNDGLTSHFKWRPTSMNDFGEIKCKATNEIGSTECIYEIKLGGVPNPPTDCTHLLKNTSAIISCQVGFHQGDPDIYCYLLRKSDNGVYKEHTRNRESCSFIVNDVNVNKLNEFWIYSSNKHGHNKDNGVYLTIGQNLKAAEPANNKTMLILFGAIGGVLFIILLCCFCIKIRKGLSDDNDSVYDNDAYQQKNANGFSNGKKVPSSIQPQNSYSSKLIKGIKSNNDDNKSYDLMNDRINEQKYVKLDFTSINKFGFNGLGNEDDGIIIIKDEKNSNTKENSNKRNKEYENEKSEYYEKEKLYDNRENESIKIYSKSTNSTNNLKNQIESSSSISNNTNINNSNEGLLKAADNNAKLDTTTTTTTSSECFFNDSNTLVQNKMVTFGAQMTMIGRRNDMNNKTIKESITTLNTASNLTASTSASGSTNTSATSPTSSSTSSTNHDDVSNNSSSAAEICNIINSSNNNSTSSGEYSFIKKSIAKFNGNNPQFNKSDKNKNEIRSPRRFINNTNESKLISPSLSPMTRSNYRFTPSLINSNNSSITRIASDLMENKYMNKLCEEIEVSLNVDCECADDYSSNDFSGDYSFDNTELQPKSPQNQYLNRNKKPNIVTSKNNVQCQNDDQNDVNISHFTELRKNFEQNIKNQLRSAENNTNNNKNSKKSNKNGDNTNVSIKNRYGVLV